MVNHAVFIDRDGTVIEEVNYLHRLEDVVIFPFSAEALRRLKEKGFLLVVVSNQSAVARGLLTEDELAAIHAGLDERLAKAGAEVDAYYYCPHHVEALVERYRTVCECRKPKPGLLVRAAQDLDIDLGRSFFVGDRISDIQAGHNAGCRSVLVRTGYGDSASEYLASLPRTEQNESSFPDYAAANLLEAAQWIIDQLSIVSCSASCEPS